MKRRVHPFTYFVAPRDNQRKLRIHQRRDLGATCELQAALLEMGYEYGEPILNAPRPVSGKKPPSKGELYHVDISFLKPGDLLLQTTRPPLDDVDHGDRKRVDPGHTDLEHRIFKVWRRYLEICARSHVKLSYDVREEIDANSARCKEMKFLQANGAPYKELNSLDGSGWRRPSPRGGTAVFLLRVEEIWKGGPGLLGAFGMDGTSTMLWAYRLRKDLAHLLREPGFVVAEMRIADTPADTTNLLWSLNSEVKILAHYREGDASPTGAAAHIP